jgi:hypothetical protein
MSRFWHWIPGKSIGPFIFGDPAGPFIRDYDLRKRRPACSIADWDTYEFPGFESWVVVEDGRIAEVHCVDAVEYEGTDLIGLPVSDVRDLLGAENKSEDNVGLGYALYYDRLGLTLFIVNEVVKAAACGKPASDQFP